MFFVCPGCSKALRVPAEKVPARPVRYTCKACGVSSSLQENLCDSRPAPPQVGDRPPATPVSDATVGTVFHHVSNLRAEDAPRARFTLHLQVRGGDGRVRNLRFEKDRVIVGRKGAEVVVQDPLVSRHHAELERVRETVLLKDLGSTNGTFLNRKQVTAGVVEPGDEIRVGNTSIRARVLIS